MYEMTTLKAEISAINAGAALLERSIQKEINLPFEKEPLFFVKAATRTFDVEINADGGYYFETFPISGTPPPKTKYITKIIPQPFLGEKRYEVTALAVASSEQIESELHSLVIPF